MKLPNGHRAIVDIRKLRDYCLNPNSPNGRNKARVFAASLGLTPPDAEILRQAPGRRKRGMHARRGGRLWAALHGGPHG